MCHICQLPRSYGERFLFLSFYLLWHKAWSEVLGFADRHTRLCRIISCSSTWSTCARRSNLESSQLPEAPQGFSTCLSTYKTGCQHHLQQSSSCVDMPASGVSEENLLVLQISEPLLWNCLVGLMLSIAVEGMVRVHGGMNV
jgi:hypothetical protein